MKISDLTSSTRKVSIVATVSQMEEPREINTKFGRTKISNATIEDETGSFTLVLWGEETDKVKEGDQIQIENGYIKEFNGVLQLSVGKFGKLTVL